MIDQEQNDREKHWRELAEQLGLPAEAEGSSHTAPPAPRTEQTAGSAEPPHNRGKGLSSRDDEPRGGNRPASDLGKEDTGQAQTEDIHPAVQEERRPQRKSTRREAPAKREKEPPLASEPSDSSAQGLESGTEEKGHKGRGPARGRGRGRSQGKPPRATGRPVGPAADTSDSTEDAAGTETDDMDNITDWNVPSWTELIESLYHPER
jgi:hypothetical protein